MAVQWRKVDLPMIKIANDKNGPLNCSFWPHTEIIKQLFREKLLLLEPSIKLWLVFDKKELETGHRRGDLFPDTAKHDDWFCSSRTEIMTEVVSLQHVPLRCYTMGTWPYKIRPGESWKSRRTITSVNHGLRVLFYEVYSKWVTGIRFYTIFWWCPAV